MRHYSMPSPPLGQGGRPVKAPDWDKVPAKQPRLWRTPRKNRLIKVERQVKGEKHIILQCKGRIGIDVGGVLLNRFSQTGEPLAREEYPNSELFLHARQAVRLLRIAFGRDNVFIVKNNGRRRLASESFDTLMSHDFFRGAGLSPKCFIPIARRAEKWRACFDLGIDFMIDDKAQVGRYLPPFTMFLQYGEKSAKEKPRHARAISRRVKKGNLRFCRVRNWREVISVIFENYDVQLAGLLTGRTSVEKADIIALWETIFEEEE